MINEYKCPNCSYKTEEIEKEESKHLCPKCKNKLKKIPSRISYFTIDGNNW